MRMKQPLHVIFDLDGTVFDTEFEVSRITAELAAEKGCALTAEDVFRDFAGLGSRDKFAGIAAASGVALSDDELSALSQAHRDRKAAIYSQDVIPVMPGVVAALEMFKNAGAVLSIGSTNLSTRSAMGMEKAGLRHYFGGGLYGPDLVDDRRKPDPSVFQLAMRENGSTPENTVVVEDSEPGLVAGRAAGAFVVGFLDPRFGNGAAARAKEAAFRKAGADAVIRDYADLARVLPYLRGKPAPRAPSPSPP